MLTRSLDGNFRQYSKKRNHDFAEVELITGAYFPDKEEYEQYLSRAGRTEEVCRI